MNEPPNVFLYDSRRGSIRLLLDLLEAMTMWVFTTDAVISAVEFDPTNGYDSGFMPPRERTHLMVRSRRGEHLVNFGIDPDSVIETSGEEYQFRAIMPKSEFGDLLKRNAEMINYEDFTHRAEESLPYGMLSTIRETVKMHLGNRKEEDVPF